MKKILFTTLALAAAVLTGCKEKTYFNDPETGLLQLSEMSSEDVMVSVETKAAPVQDNYIINIYDAQQVLAHSTTWGKVKENNKQVLLMAGNYKMVVCSENSVPAAEFEHPVYGSTTNFSIKAGEITQLGEIKNGIVQAKVSISYNEEFLAAISGDGEVAVSINDGEAAKFFVKENPGSTPSYEQRCAYLAANMENPNTMIVTFSGSIDGKISKMTKVFEGIKCGQWHKITFAKKIIDEGNASFSIGIDGFIEDEDLDTDVEASEDIIGEDPETPSGDGGIKLESTCDYALDQDIVVPAAGEKFTLTMKATVPNKVNKFTVEMQSTNPDFISSVKQINDGSTTLDLVNPSSGAIDVFTTILPFPYGEQVNGKQEIDFDLSDAQTPILAFEGRHTFIMKVTDKKGCKKEVCVVMVVNPAN